MRATAFFLLMTSISLMAQASASGPAAEREYRLEVSVRIAQSALDGVLRFASRPGMSEELRVGDLIISGVFCNGNPVPVQFLAGTIVFKPPEEGLVEVRFKGIFSGGEPTGDKNYGVVSSLIDGRGVSLTGLWHPQPAGLARWRLSATLPKGYEAISEAESVSRSTRGELTEFSFAFPHPLDALSLVASNRFEVVRERAGAVELIGYFFKEDRKLAASYLRHAKKYLALYEKMLSPYPYKRFCVVENFLPTGYSLPTFTLLGQDVVRLPFIVETSLGHEILHQWFGNSVYVDEQEGNWAEGLTSYLADHWYDEQKGKGWEHRKQLLLNFMAYVNESNDFPLKEFRSRTDRASRAIGYGKAAMVFHQLRKQAGDETFFGALRNFISERQYREGSWSDIRSAFERATGKDLKAYFAEWLDGKGIPDISVENLSLQRKASAFEIAFDVTRKNSVLPIEVPVEISFLRGGGTAERIAIDTGRRHMAFSVDQEPSRAVIDNNYDVLRQPAEEEVPPMIAAVIGAQKPFVVLPPSGRDAYEPVITGFTEKGGTVREPGEVAVADLRTATVIILGKNNPVAERLFGAVDMPSGGFTIDVRKNPWNSGKMAALVESSSAEETEAAFSKIYHYGKYSTLSFERGRNTAKKLTPAERGIALLLREEPMVIDLRTLGTFSSIVEGASDKRILYVGEYHDRFSHHTVQLDFIRTLYKKDPHISVGMEMFQRPFQKTLDEYIDGTTGEKEFLKHSEYFKRWGYDYNLYKPILDFCRANHIPVVALNLRREIVEKVSKGGMDSLSDEEREELPRETDFSDARYRDRLLPIFAQHRREGGEERSFDFFLQSQVLWDETMAESVDDYLRKNPGRRMVVIAGGGHLAYGSGIPRRAFRRNGFSYSIVLNDGELETGVADYLIFPQAMEGMTAPLLKVAVREAAAGLVLSGLAQDGPAQAAGLKRGDVLVAVDGAPLTNLQDLKMALFYKKKGDAILVTVERKRFLFGTKEMTVEVKL